MKTSNKILLSALVIILLPAGLVLIRLGSVVFYGHPQLVTFVDGPAKPVSREYQVQDFSALDIEGIWSVKVQRADSFSVSLKAPEKLLRYVTLNVSGNTLQIKQAYFSPELPPVAEILIKMPVLKGIKSWGRNKIDFLGFKSEVMILESFGFNDLVGRNSYIDNIQLSGTGIVNNNLSASTVVNAKLALTGLGTTTLNIAGGKLEGQISSNINVVSNGNISQKNISIIEDAIIEKQVEDFFK